ncbi:cytochrome P450 [Gigaspora rosea]|uniref:Cytochrome P450 n=1 Tax=Gigaspora rosea TaxID=44941 RepID=A0A397UJY3_9GLOM|nr:cytochrome P450 [Gigaspora rosea]
MAYIEIFSLLLSITYIFYLIKRPRIGLNEPPLVPYRFPIIGHTYDFLAHDSENFLTKCKEKYGEPFSLYVFGSVRTFTGVGSSPEVLRHDGFDFHKAKAKIFPAADIFKPFFEDLSVVSLARVVREQVSGKMNIYASRMQKELLSGIEEYIGNCKEPKVIKNIREMTARIIAKPVANIVLGEECAQFEDIIGSFTVVENELQKMRYAPKFLLFIHPSFYKFFAVLPLKFGWNPISHHRDLFVQRCKPIVEERIRQRKELGEKYIQKEDLLDFFISESKTDVVDNKLMDRLFANLYSVVFASINTTSRSLSFALFDYGGRPELWNELYEEQLKIHSESNGYLSIEDVNKMVKLDCFLKESLRHSSPIAGLVHVLIDDSYTFSNGTTIPKGRDVSVFIKDTAFNDKFFGETSSDFQPKRHITLYPNGTIVHSPATKVDKSFITFGGGKHACPGRFFAVNEIKMGLHKLILKYNIRTESGKVVPPIKMSSVKILPNSGLIFENRN